MLVRLRNLIDRLALKGTNAEVASALNTKSIAIPKSENITLAGLAVALGVDRVRAMLAKFAPAAKQDPFLESMLRKFESTGIDFSHPQTHAVLDSLVAAGVLTRSEVDALKEVGVVRKSPYEQEFGEGTTVTEEEVAAARQAELVADDVRTTVSVLKESARTLITITRTEYFRGRPIGPPAVTQWASGQPMPGDYANLISAIIATL